ncbi:MAG: hypothetical protein COU31_02265 [Candidatus Magasanikbacteria bacterium CG10_big_fil_rev_8_21_14_0_10_40_10]|uniref:AI-2E family transporter n=1 Tax=Candidatus Magasanikbacteria bacterium CG10_big_fil_rev_8_21_14_0_10_40_10 TaxID=1974648 RepID=A0A2M6W490_9BACT|nr:MAG: hypothetical protein COU31_02265 [Candidatus Magasanikbacteria bacterium CG10_big_fil_rev_8_21_14_0_10_40_10]
MDFAKLRDTLFFGLLVLVTLLFFYLIKPFAMPIFWAAVIASIFYPLYKILKKYLKLERVSIILTMVLVFVIIIIPAVFISSLLIRESINLYTAIDSNRSQIHTNITQTLYWLQNNSLTKDLNFNESFWLDKFSEVTKIVSSYIFTSLRQLTQDSLLFFAMFLITFYTLYYFLRDGEKMLKKLMYLSPLGDKNEEMLYKKFTSTARAAIKGTLIVGLIQGTLGGILFAVAGIQSALIWGVIMVLASIIPAMGTSVVWLPAGIIMIIVGDVWQGILILTFGAIVISTIDNFVRPILIGKDTQMHPLIILFSTLGGIIIFGISGFVIGPIIAALLFSLWEMYSHHYRRELGNN